MQLLNTLLSIAALSTLATATLKPASSNTKGFYPKSPACKGISFPPPPPLPPPSPLSLLPPPTTRTNFPL